MQIVIPDLLAEFVSNQAALEGFSHPNDYVVTLVLRARQKLEMEEELVKGVESLDKGEGIKLDEAGWEMLRAKLKNK